MRPDLSLLLLIGINFVSSDQAADQLYEDLLYYYNRNVRPVKNASDIMDVGFASSLIRIIRVDEIAQILTTNLWLKMQWMDHKLVWDPETYGGIEKLHVPSDQIWTPDIVLYNNADGSPDITIMADALVLYTGQVIWNPPAIYNSFCEINIEYFPYDSQECEMKFGGWTYNGFFMNVYQTPVVDGDVVQEKTDDKGKKYHYLEHGMDISYFYESAEWDLMNLTSERHEALYPGCCGQEMYIDITFYLYLRRKPLFYTANLIIPTMLIAILTTFVFYIPSADHKIGFSISIMVTLIFFFNILIDLLPPTSLVIPLIGRYLLFTVFLVGLSIFISVCTLNLFHRNGGTHRMPRWMRWLFLEKLPKPLCIKPKEFDDDEDSSISDTSSVLRRCSSTRRPSPYFMNAGVLQETQDRLSSLARNGGLHPELLQRIIENVRMIAEHFRSMEEENRISEDWSYVAMVIDRLFLIFFTIINITGTLVILLQAPYLFDNEMPLRKEFVTKPLGGDTYNITTI